MVVAVLRGVESQRPRGHPGQALVEFALVGPILVLLFLGATDLTRAFYTYIVLTNASREAARVIIDYPQQYSDAAACAAAHREAFPILNLSCTSSPATIVINPAANTGVSPPVRLPGRLPVTVTTKAIFQPWTFVIQWFTGPSLTIQSSTTYITWY